MCHTALAVLTDQWRGTGGREPGRKGTGSGRREGAKRECQGGGNREKTSIISHHFIIFRNRYKTKRRRWLRKGAGGGSKRYGRREVQTPLSPSTDQA